MLLNFENNSLLLLNPNLPPFPTPPFNSSNTWCLSCKSEWIYWQKCFGLLVNSCCLLWEAIYYPAGASGETPLFGVKGEQMESAVFIKMDHTTENQPLPHSCGYRFFPFLLHWAYHKSVCQQLHLWYSDSLPELMKCLSNSVFAFLLPSDKNKMSALITSNHWNLMFTKKN